MSKIDKKEDIKRYIEEARSQVFGGDLIKSPNFCNPNKLAKIYKKDVRAFKTLNEGYDKDIVEYLETNGPDQDFRDFIISLNEKYVKKLADTLS